MNLVTIPLYSIHEFEWIFHCSLSMVRTCCCMKWKGWCCFSLKLCEMPFLPSSPLTFRGWGCCWGFWLFWGWSKNTSEREVRGLLSWKRGNELFLICLHPCFRLLYLQSCRVVEKMAVVVIVGEIVRDSLVRGRAFVSRRWWAERNG